MIKPSHTLKVKYKVVMRNRVRRISERMPKRMQDRLDILVKDLEENGAFRKNWPNFSELGANRYHCHLGYHWVACWLWEKGTIEIEVYYAGSRENAPY